MIDGYVDTAHIADKAGISKARVCQLLQDGTIKGQKLESGGQGTWLIKENEAKKFLKKYQRYAHKRPKS